MAHYACDTAVQSVEVLVPCFKPPHCLQRCRAPSIVRAIAALFGNGIELHFPLLGADFDGKGLKAQFHVRTFAPGPMGEVAEALPRGRGAFH